MPVKPDAPQQGDERMGSWTRAQLLAMNRRFCQRVERALKREARAKQRDASTCRAAGIATGRTD
jgi:hypothetical protein